MNYLVYINDWAGNRLSPISGADSNEFESLRFTRVVNDVGVLILVYAGRLDPILTQTDNQIEVYRVAANGAPILLTETTWFLRRVRVIIDGSGATFTELTGYSGSYLLSGRSIAYNAGTRFASKTGEVQNILRQIVRENIGPDARNPERSISTEYLQVEQNETQFIPFNTKYLPFGLIFNPLLQPPTAGFQLFVAETSPPTFTKGFAWRSNMLKVLREVCETAEVEGLYVAFDVVTTSIGKFSFRTYFGQRGTDRRPIEGNQTLLVGVQYGNVVNLIISLDETDSSTYVYVPGQGEGSARALGFASNDNLLRTVWSRREHVGEGRSGRTVASLNSAASALLKEREPRLNVKADLVETESFRYGIDWNWGDYVRIDAGNGLSFDARIEGISGEVTSNNERITAYLQADL